MTESDLSGPFAGAGSVPLSIGAQLSIDYVNGKGGVAGKYKIEGIAADSQSKADVAINEVERLISQEKVDIVLGVYSSAHAVPLAAKVDEQKKILWINSAIATAVLKDLESSSIFHPVMLTAFALVFVTSNQSAPKAVPLLQGATSVMARLPREPGDPISFASFAATVAL